MRSPGWSQPRRDSARWTGTRFAVAELLEALDRLETVRRKAAASAWSRRGRWTAATHRALGRDPAPGGRRCPADQPARGPPPYPRRPANSAPHHPDRPDRCRRHCRPPPRPGTPGCSMASTCGSSNASSRELPDHVHPAAVGQGRGVPGRAGRRLRPDQLEKLAARLAMHPQPRRQVLRRRPRPQARLHLVRTPAPRRHEHGRADRHPGTAGHARGAGWPSSPPPGCATPTTKHPPSPANPARPPSTPTRRSHAQRQHDALVGTGARPTRRPGTGPAQRPAGHRHRHRRPCEQLQTAAGHAVTAGGTLLPMPDVIRMASHAYHYLCVFDEHTERALYLGRTKRIASADQRIVLHAKDRGCTAPVATCPATCPRSTTSTNGPTAARTNIDNLTFACKPRPPTHQARRLDHPKTHQTAAPNGFHRRTSRSPAAPTPTTTPSGCCPTDQPDGRRLQPCLGRLRRGRPAREAARPR